MNKDQELIDQTLINPDSVLIQDGRYFSQGKECTLIFTDDLEGLKKAIEQSQNLSDKLLKQSKSDFKSTKRMFLMSILLFVGSGVSCFFLGQSLALLKILT